jgi:flagellar basal-body rod protein FlgB
MYLSSLTNRGATPALIATMIFNEARLRTTAENIANMQTPGYRAKQLDARGFQAALRRALDEKGDNATKTLNVESGREVRTRTDGSLMVQPSERPVDNVLFHDGTNMSLEREMAELAETGMTHEMVAALLQGRFDGLRKAIRGTVS